MSCLSTPLHPLLLLLDVDGVVRSGIDSKADPRVIKLVQALIQHPHIQVVFLSGTPVSNDPSLEPWRRGNLPLTAVFGGAFDVAMQEQKVVVYGMLGGQRLHPGGKAETLDSYPLSISFELARLITAAFLEEILQHGSSQNQEKAQKIQEDLERLSLIRTDQPLDATPLEFASIAQTIRTSFDPEFRLITNGAMVETHVSLLPYYQARRAVEWISDRLKRLHPTLSPHIACGIAHKDKQKFHFLLLSKVHKGLTARRLIREKLASTPRALILTIGDTQIDFPMHQEAHLAFHVGLEEVWKANPLPHCILIKDLKGNDQQHVEGTLQVLRLIQKNINHSIPDLCKALQALSSG